MEPLTYEIRKINETCWELWIDDEYCGDYTAEHKALNDFETYVEPFIGNRETKRI